MLGLKKLMSQIEGLFSARASTRVRVLYLVLITLIAQPLLIMPIWNVPLYKNALYARLIHLALAWCTFFYIIFNKNIKRSVGLFLYALILLPLSVPLWFSQTSLAASGAQNLSFTATHMLFFSTAILYSGSFLLNSICLLFFSAEIILIWFTYSSSYNPSEPFLTMMVAFISFCILVFRKQDENTYRRLMREQYRSNVLENLARLFLSLRDRANTPLQSLFIMSSLLKADKPLSQETIDQFNSIINQLKTSSDQLKNYENLIQLRVNDRHIVTDKELEGWISNLEKEENGSFDS